MKLVNKISNFYTDQTTRISNLFHCISKSLSPSVRQNLHYFHQERLFLIHFQKLNHAVVVKKLNHAVVSIKFVINIELVKLSRASGIIDMQCSNLFLSTPSIHSSPLSLLIFASRLLLLTTPCLFCLADYILYTKVLLSSKF